MSFAAALNRIASTGGPAEESPKASDNVKRPRLDRDNSMTIEQYANKLQNDCSLVNSHKILVIRGFVAYAFDPISGEWTRLADSRRDRSYFEAVRLGTYVYAIGTYNVTASGTVERLSLIDNRWETCEPMPVKLRSVSAVVVNDCIYVTGGICPSSMEASNAVHIYQPNPSSAGSDTSASSGTDMTIGRWTTATDMSMLIPRYRHGSVVYQNKLWVIGGIIKNSYGQEEYTSTCECLDLSTSSNSAASGQGLWSPGPSTCARRAIDVCPLVIGNSLYLVGGDMKGVVHHSNACDKQSADHGTIERFDPEMNQFVTVAKFNRVRRGFSAAASEDMKIYVFGGRDGDQDLTTWDVYDTVIGKWRATDVVGGTMPMDCLWGQAVAL